MSYQGQDDQQITTSGVVLIGSGSMANYGPSYNFTAPYSGTYLVRLDTTAIPPNSSGSFVGALYFQIVVGSNTYNSYPSFLYQQSSIGDYENFHAMYPVIMNSGSNTIQLQAQTQTNAAWQFDTNCWRKFIVIGC